MLGMKSGALALGAMLLMGLGEVAAQEPPAQRGPGMHGGGGPEMVLSMRDQLDLTQDQIAELNELRERMVGIRTSHRSAMASLRSRFQAGEIDREEMTTSMEAIRSGGPQVHEEMQSRIASILDEEQLASFEELRQSRQAVRDGRGMRRGGGPGAMQGHPGAMRGDRGAMRGDPGAMRGDPGAMRGPGMRGDGQGGMGPGAAGPGGVGPDGMRPGGRGLGQGPGGPMGGCPAAGAGPGI